MPVSPSTPGGNEESGVVIRSTGSWYDVKTADNIISSRIRGKFRLSSPDQTSPVVVGDRVDIRLDPDGTGLIVCIHDRFNRIVRRAAGRKVGREHVIMANVDAAWIVQSVLYPKINPGFIDRVIVMVSLYDIDVGIIINKNDLIEDEFQDTIVFWTEVYRTLGYSVLSTSALTGDGLDVLASVLKDKTSAILGPSGVGKSSLLNVIEPDLNIVIGDVSMRTGKGTHTTTSSTLYPLLSGGFVADTPGLREFGLIDLEPDMLSHYFVEFDRFAEQCHYPNCTHDHEPECRVKEAVESGAIYPERYESYLNMLYSLRQGEKDVGR